MYAQDNNSLPVWFILSPAYHHISISSQPFLVRIVSARSTRPASCFDMKISADSWFGRFNGMSKSTLKSRSSLFLKKKPRSHLLLLGRAPINTTSPHKRLIWQMPMRRTPSRTMLKSFIHSFRKC